jgi:hypothetical protein
MTLGHAKVNISPESTALRTIDDLRPRVLYIAIHNILEPPLDQFSVLGWLTVRNRQEYVPFRSKIDPGHGAQKMLQL